MTESEERVAEAERLVERYRTLVVRRTILGDLEDANMYRGLMGDWETILEARRKVLKRQVPNTT